MRVGVMKAVLMGELEEEKEYGGVSTKLLERRFASSKLLERRFVSSKLLGRRFGRVSAISVTLDHCLKWRNENG